MKKSTIFFLVLIAFLFVSLLFSLYLNFNKSPTASIPTPTPDIIPTETIDSTADWKTYNNTEYGYSFRLPNDWGDVLNMSAVEAYTRNGNDVHFSIHIGKPQTQEEGYEKYIFSDGKIGTRKFIVTGNNQYTDIVTIKNTNGEYFLLFKYCTLNKYCPLDKKEAKILFDQILSTFKFTNNTPTPTPTIAVNKVKILDTSSWVEYSCSSISYKLPSNYNQKCELAFNGIQGTDQVLYVENGKYGDGRIIIEKYDGGSRRQFWFDTIQGSPSEVSKHVRFQESQFGSVSGLDVFASSVFWQGSSASSILIAHDKTIVSIFGGRDFNDITGKITRWDISDTIASTIKFL